MSEQELYNRLQAAFEGTNVSFEEMDELGSLIIDGEHRYFHRCFTFFGIIEEDQP